ncbi:hypothetical protein D6C89_03764 [Aureobasidium pullulans]|nr:hypothetical protein D6C89_03764 [Aureobasidium pullulans]
MPPKRAKKGAIGQTEKAIADTQAAVEEATQHAVREQDTQSDAVDAETQVDADPHEKKIRKKKRKNDPTNFHAYIHKVQKEMYPTLSMSKTAMCIMNDFTNGK